MLTMTKDKLDLHLEFERVDDTIIIARYLDSRPITGEIAREMVRLRKEFTQNKEFKTVIVFPTLTNMDKAGRDYLASDEAKEGIIASAMVSKSVLARAIINFFLKLNNKGRNDYPNKVFSSEKDALQWIREINVF